MESLPSHHTSSLKKESLRLTGFIIYHREHTLLLNRKRVNKGMKRTNSLPLSPVVPTRPYCRENRYLQGALSIWKEKSVFPVGKRENLRRYSSFLIFPGITGKSLYHLIYHTRAILLCKNTRSRSRKWRPPSCLSVQHAVGRLYGSLLFDFRWA